MNEWTAHPRRDASAVSVVADYPHVASCGECGRYARSHADTSPLPLAAAILTHHEAGHRGDPLTLASQHFA